jgi:hypothetical protein
MNRTITSAVCLLGLLAGTPAIGTSWDRVVFRDDCDVLDPDVWIVNHPGQWWWTQGRSHFPEPSTPPPSPRAEGGVCVLEHHLYDPWDLADPNTVFLGAELRSVREFAPDGPLRFEARVRTVASPDGLVTSFFLYGYDGADSDEIDFEFVSNQTNDAATWPNGDPVLTNTWNESFQLPAYVPPQGLFDLTQWNTFRITWWPGEHRVEWAWVDPEGGETLLRSETDAFFVPDEPMAVYFNFWAPTASWPDAYDATLQPVNAPQQNTIHRYEIDYLEVRASSAPVPALTDGSRAALAVMVAVAGVLSLLLRAGDSAKKISSPTKKHEARPGPARSPDRSGVARASARGPRGSDPD